jgi:hypothetical protein
LSDSTAQALGLGSDPTVDDALFKLQNAGFVTDAAGNRYEVVVDEYYAQAPPALTEGPFGKLNVKYNDDYITCLESYGSYRRYYLYDWDFNILRTCDVTVGSANFWCAYFDLDCFVIIDQASSYSTGYICSWDGVKTPYAVSSWQDYSLCIRESDYLYISETDSAARAIKWDIDGWSLATNITHPFAGGTNRLVRDGSLYAVAQVWDAGSQTSTICLYKDSTRQTLINNTNKPNLNNAIGLADGRPGVQNPKMYFAIFFSTGASYTLYELDVLTAQLRQLYASSNSLAPVCLFDNGTLLYVEATTAYILDLDTLARSAICGGVSSSATQSNTLRHLGVMSHKCRIVPYGQNQFINLEAKVGFVFNNYAFATSSSINFTNYPYCFQNSTPTSKILLASNRCVDLTKRGQYAGVRVKAV